jgi:hypothetical protein|eukprot:COSAG02_NODE_603_length_19693_cov_3.883944_21_plen_75_part_00
MLAQPTIEHEPEAKPERKQPTVIEQQLALRHSPESADTSRKMINAMPVASKSDDDDDEGHELTDGSVRSEHLSN